jgi:hypothetical protein
MLCFVLESIVNRTSWSVDEVLTEENLAALYGVPPKRLTFEHAGRMFETLAPVLNITSAGGTRSRRG